MRKDVLEWMEKHECLHIMLDLRNIEEVKIGTTNIYRLPEKYILQTIPHKFKLALLVAQKDLQDYRFFETVCQNNGFNILMFFDFESALGWLKK